MRGAGSAAGTGAPGSPRPALAPHSPVAARAPPSADPAPPPPPTEAPPGPAGRAAGWEHEGVPDPAPRSRRAGRSAAHGRPLSWGRSYDLRGASGGRQGAGAGPPGAHAAPGPGCPLCPACAPAGSGARGPLPSPCGPVRGGAARGPCPSPGEALAHVPARGATAAGPPPPERSRTPGPQGPSGAAARGLVPAGPPRCGAYGSPGRVGRRSAHPVRGRGEKLGPAGLQRPVPADGGPGSPWSAAPTREPLGRGVSGRAPGGNRPAPAGSRARPSAAAGPGRGPCGPRRGVRARVRGHGGAGEAGRRGVRFRLKDGGVTGSAGSGKLAEAAGIAPREQDPLSARRAVARASDSPIFCLCGRGRTRTEQDPVRTG